MIEKFTVSLPPSEPDALELGNWLHDHQAKGHVLVDVQMITRESWLAPTTRMQIYVMDDGASIAEEAALTIPSKQR